jgi:hypothetical protein
MTKWVVAIVIAVMTGIIGFAIYPSIRTTMTSVQQIEQTVDNYSFEIADPPEDWSTSGVGATFSRSNTQAKIGTYSGEIIRNGNNAIFYQNYGTRYNDKTITFGCWVWASAANRCEIYISDGVTTTDSTSHSGSSGWEWLTVTQTISSSATYCHIACMVYGGDTTGYFDGAVLYLGDSLPEADNPAMLRFAKSSLPYIMVFFIGYAVYLGYKRIKGT